MKQHYADGQQLYRHINILLDLWWAVLFLLARLHWFACERTLGLYRMKSASQHTCMLQVFKATGGRRRRAVAALLALVQALLHLGSRRSHRLLASLPVTVPWTFRT